MFFVIVQSAEGFKVVASTETAGESKTLAAEAGKTCATGDVVHRAKALDSFDVVAQPTLVKREKKPEEPGAAGGE